MRAMLLTATGSLDANPAPLELANIDDPIPVGDQILIRVAACGVCHTELDEIEGRTPPPSLPVVPGHEVVGRVVASGPGASRFRRGDLEASHGHCSMDCPTRSNFLKSRE